MAKRDLWPLQLKISLSEVKPQIWRRVLVSSETTLHELHRIIQMTFEWYDYHLYEFEIGDQRYQRPDSESDAEDSTHARLRDLELAAGDAFTYLYDFGDSWMHRLQVERVPRRTDARRLPYVISGERRGPPEDCGGPGGFERFLEAVRNPSHPEHHEYRAWVGDSYEPETFDLQTVRHAVLLAAAWGAR